MKKVMKNILSNIGLIKIIGFFYYIFLKLFRKIRNYFLPTAYILLYHRVANSKQDPHDLCVSPENFASQMKYIKNNFIPISLETLVDDIKNKRVKNNSIVITFDDGYVDNFKEALPILRENKIPATVFVTSGKIDSEGDFFWNEKIDENEKGRAMNSEELIEFNKESLISIGSHTINHIHLEENNIEEQRKEIFESKKMLENKLNEEVLFFSYPFGGSTSKNDNTIKLVKQAGYKAACENFPDRVTNYSDLFRLPRFIIRDWNVEIFKNKIKTFL